MKRNGHLSLKLKVLKEMHQNFSLRMFSSIANDFNLPVTLCTRVKGSFFVGYITEQQQQLQARKPYNIQQVSSSSGLKMVWKDRRSAYISIIFALEQGKQVLIISTLLLSFC